MMMTGPGGYMLAHNFVMHVQNQTQFDKCHLHLLWRYNAMSLPWFPHQQLPLLAESKNDQVVTTSQYQGKKLQQGQGRLSYRPP